MCGIIGIVGTTDVAPALYDGLTVLQHRGQDAAGIATVDGARLRLHKDNGLATIDVARHLARGGDDDAAALLRREAVRRAVARLQDA